MKTYAVKETFRTIQGEGAHAGTPAVFLRLAGCNMWTGREQDRERDAERHGAQCPRWCDTDFVGGIKLDVDAVRAEVMRLHHGQPLIVITGGEPLLQVDDELLDVLHELEGHPIVAIETNGTAAPQFDVGSWLDTSSELGEIEPLLWLTMSPKLAPEATKLRPEWLSEVKVVWPDYDIDAWGEWLAGNDHVRRFVQPRAAQSVRDRMVEQSLAQLLMAGRFPGWRMSLQQHKILEVP